jgi:hypothetical protein
MAVGHAKKRPTRLVSGDEIGSQVAKELKQRQDAGDCHCKDCSLLHQLRVFGILRIVSDHHRFVSPSLRMMLLVDTALLIGYVLIGTSRRVYQDRSLEISAKVPSNFVIVIVNGSLYDLARSLNTLNATCSPNKIDQKVELRKWMPA